MSEETRTEIEEEEVVNVASQLNWHSTDTVWISFVSMCFLLPACYADDQFVQSLTSILLHIYLFIEFFFNIALKWQGNLSWASKIRVPMLSTFQYLVSGFVLSETILVVNAKPIFYMNLFSVFTMMLSVCFFQQLVFDIKKSYVLWKTRVSKLIFIACLTHFSWTFYILLYLPYFLLNKDKEHRITVQYHVLFATVTVVIEWFLYFLFKFTYRICYKKQR